MNAKKLQVLKRKLTLKQDTYLALLQLLCGFNKENKTCYTDYNVKKLECYRYQILVIHLFHNKIREEANYNVQLTKTFQIFSDTTFMCKKYWKNCAS